MAPTANQDRATDRVDEDRDGRVRFFSLTFRESDLLRLAVLALVAYFFVVELVYLLGYAIPTIDSLPPAITIVAPYLLLAAVSLIALFIRPPLGLVLALISLLVILIASLAPAQR